MGAPLSDGGLTGAIGGVVHELLLSRKPVCSKRRSSLPHLRRCRRLCSLHRRRSVSCHPKDGDNRYGNDPPEGSQQPPELTVDRKQHHQALWAMGAKNLAIALVEPCMRITSNTLPL